MKNMIIGTAGHVDHGKTMLIKALTGIDTDRLAEEKKRGITIDLGFAYLELPDGSKAGIVDVPGHEKFIKNMLAGAGGIDLVLMVIAADDGIMPQTREHLGILGLMSAREGIVALTKADMVEADWLALVAEDIRREIRGTFLADAPILPVSSLTGQGIAELRAEIVRRWERMPSKNVAGPCRVPVDRVFSVDGFGTVVTGTMIEGALAKDGEIELYPSGARARARHIQVHSQSVEQAYAGQRVAINLAGLKKEDARRGDIVASPGAMKNSRLLDVRFSVLRDSPRAVAHGTRLHFYHGTGDTLCRLILLERDKLEPGQDGYGQLRFPREIAVRAGDHFVARFYSPLETVGGGVILNADPPKRRRGGAGAAEALRLTEQGSDSDRLLQALTDGSPHFTPLAEIKSRLPLDETGFEAAFERLAQAGDILPLDDKHWISRASFDDWGARLNQTLRAYHQAHPLLPGPRREDLRGRWLPGREIHLADKLMELCAREGLVRLAGKTAALPDFQVCYSEKERQLAQQVEQLYLRAGYAPPTADEVYAQFPKDKAALRQVLDALLEEDILLPVAPQLYFHRDIGADSWREITEFIAARGQITLGEFRDLVGTSRKFAMALLEYFDRKGATKKKGEGRVLA